MGGWLSRFEMFEGGVRGAYCGFAWGVIPDSDVSIAALDQPLSHDEVVG